MKIAPSFPSRFKLLQRRAAVLVAFLLPVAMSITFASSNETSWQGRAQQGRAKRVIVISLDGLDARYLNRRDEYGLKIPNLRRLMRDGATARGVVSVFPSVTYPAHTTIVTGAYPARHGIYGNEMLDAPVETTATRREWYWYARDIRVETLWDAARQRGLKVGMVSWPVGAGAGDYNVPEILKFGGTLQDSLQLIIANSLPVSLVAEIQKRDPALFSQANKDEQDDMRTRMAEYLITEKRPEVLLVHLFDLDHFEHEKGPFTPEAFAILEKLDAYVGRILEAARRAGTLDETAVFIVSDHGFMPVSKQAHPGVLLVRAGLIAVREEKDVNRNYVNRIVGWRAMPFETNGSCAIILKDENDREALEKVRAIFRPLAGQAGSGIREVLEGKRLRELGANPRAALMLDGAEGYAFGKNFLGEYITPHPQLGAHGFLPTRQDYYASFIAAGAGINHQQLGIIHMINIGPTIARSLGLTLRDAEGRYVNLR